LILFWGNTWSDKMSNPKADWPGRNDQSVRRLLENYRNDPESIEHRAASGKRRKTTAGCPVKVRPFCASKQQKNAHFH